MPFKFHVDRKTYKDKYNAMYYKKKRLEVLAQKQVYYERNKKTIQAKMAANRKGKEIQAAANTRAWYAANTEKAKSTAMRVRFRNAYGIDLSAYESMCGVQKGRCAVCGIRPKKRLCVDHCHRTKKVRGLLCRQCNAGIGLLKDDPKILSKAVKYLKGES